MLTLFALRNILRNKRRSLVTAVTVAVGTGALFIFMGFNTGILNQYRENAVHARFGFGQLNTKGYRDKALEKPWEHWIENGNDVAAKVLKLPEVTQVFPRVEFFALLSNGNVSVAGRGIGIVGKEEASFFNTMNIIEGDVLRDTEDGLILGVGLAKALNVHVGDNVTILGNTIYGSMNGVDLKVKGVFHAGSRDIDDVIFQMQLSQAQTLLDTKRIESIALGLKGHDSWPIFAPAVAKEFPELDATPFNILDKIYYQQSVDWLKSQFDVIKLIILTIVLLGIFNTSSSAIMERTREIGTLRANGESTLDIVRMLAIEGAAVALGGAVLGLLLVLGMHLTILRNGIVMPPSPGITRQFAIFLELQWSAAFESLILGVITAVFANVLAGLKVARMPIARALASAG